ncbi:MAG: metal ABC transporter ATP-binding protein [Nitrospira bacterium HGW-Nitrospira-1]|nr:MAG: metal ABC transporter ATP-binding protein [Nitrospira bacterium HGW-Nitrospira-1]
MKIAIDISNVSVTISDKEILKNINISLEEGHFLGIVGPNGGGKTTLIKVILGLIKPTSGSVSIFGAPPDSLILGNGFFGYLPQHQNIDPNFPATSLDIVLMGRYRKAGFFRWPGQKDREIAMKYMSIMGIENLKGAQYSRLSGGQQQRVSIARALAGEPRILILDEPSTGIDVVGQENFYHLLKGLQKKMNLTILMVSHDIGSVTTYVDEISCLNIKLYYHGNPLGALSDKVMTSLYGKNVDLLMHTDACDKCERLRP